MKESNRQNCKQSSVLCESKCIVCNPTEKRLSSHKEEQTGVDRKGIYYGEMSTNDRCTKRYKTISDLKAHYKTETIKFQKLDRVVHAKVGRTEDSEIKEGNYFKEDFCSTKI